MEVEKVLQNIIQLNLGKMFHNLYFVHICSILYSFIRNHNKFSTITVFVSFKAAMLLHAINPKKRLRFNHEILRQPPFDCNKPRFKIRF